MNALISKMLLMSLVLLSFSGCAEKVVYVDRPVEVKVPQKCVVPEVHCEFTGTYTERVSKVEICIANFNKAIEVCR